MVYFHLIIHTCHICHIQRNSKETITMIRKFGVKNFSCFNEGINVDFTFDGKVPKSVSQGKDYTTVLGIKGANGSGKTNIIKAIYFLSNFCGMGSMSDLKVDDLIPINSFFRNDRPSEFYIEFEQDGCIYNYELSLSESMVFSEVLHKKVTKKSSKVVKLLERKNSEIIFTTPEFKELETIKLKDNSSVINQFTKYRFKSEMLEIKSIHRFFFHILTNVSNLGYFDHKQNESEISKEYSKDPERFNFVKKIIMSADSGIQDIIIHSRKNEHNEEYYFPLFTHVNKGHNQYLTYYEQSSGTQSLYNKMSMYWLVLKLGGLLALDEFDIHIHSLILPKIIDLFLNEKINTKNAQFIFTAHNTELIDSLGKYRTILVNKEDNESYCYRLDEIPGTMIRNDRAITPLYLQGKLGGVPSVEEI